MGRAFYDTYEAVLNFAMKSRGKFHSYIQSDNLSMDLDKKGFLLNIEVMVSKDDWTPDAKLAPPENAPFKKLRFLDYRLTISGESYLTNRSKDMLYIRFSDDDHIKTYEIAENLFADVNVVSELAGLWILGVQDDYGFKSEMAFRRGDKVSQKD